MSLLRRSKRDQSRRDAESLKHLQKVNLMANTLIEQKVLKIYPEECRALFPRQIWDTKDTMTKHNITKNIALHILSLKTSSDPDAVMELELFDFDFQPLATYKEKKVKLL